MKTENEIIKWIESQEWAWQFYKNCLNHPWKSNPWKSKKTTEIVWDKNCLHDSFNWRETPEGRDVWEERDTKFLSWFNKDERPLTWDAYCEQHPKHAEECRIHDNCCIHRIGFEHAGEQRDPGRDMNVMDYHLCAAFIAYMKLMQLRNDWNKDCQCEEKTYRIVSTGNGVNTHGEVKMFNESTSGLSFVSADTAEMFMTTFGDLIKTAMFLL